MKHTARHNLCLIMCVFTYSCLLYFSLSNYLCLSVCFSLSLSVCLSVCLCPLFLSVCLSLSSLSVCMSVFVFLHPTLSHWSCLKSINTRAILMGITCYTSAHPQKFTASIKYSPHMHFFTKAFFFYSWRYWVGFCFIIKLQKLPFRICKSTWLVIVSHKRLEVTVRN